MAPPPRPHDSDDDDDDDDLLNPRHNPYASASQWRHQESPAFARHAVQPRDADGRGRVNDLADFLNSSRIAPPAAKSSKRIPRAAKSTPIMTQSPPAPPPEAGPAAADADAEASDVEPHSTAAPDGKDIAVGPLLNYRRMAGASWIGSVLVVTKGGGERQPFWPVLVLKRAGPGPAAADTNGEPTPDDAQETESQGICLYSDPRNTFWRFDVAVDMGPVESKWEYSLPGLRFRSKTKPQTNAFYVPAVTESMRIMFHSCNGFSVGTDEDAWSGPALWNDVLRRHSETPFHVMIGGGDQIYNDGIRVSGPLHKWTAISNPKKRRDFPFPESLRLECDDYYLKNYIRWSVPPWIPPTR